MDPVTLHSPVTAPTLETMGPFIMPAALQRARCMTNGQLTPPPSPDDIHPDQDHFDPIPKLRSVKHTAIRLQEVKAMTSQHESKASDPPKPSFMSPSKFACMYRPEARTHKSIPFPSSPVMAEHFTYDDYAPHTPAELRRVTDSYGNLRNLAREHEKEYYLSLPVTAPFQTTLLPSPLLEECKMASNDSTYKSYDDMRIISCYEDVFDASVDDSDQNRKRSPQEHTIKPDHTQPNCGTFATTLPQRPKAHSNKSSTSSESDWLANTTSHQQRLRKFKARCYQVVQHPFRAEAPKCEEEGKIMLATVLVGPGKPKLVQIQRPTSSTNSSKLTDNQSNQSLQTLRNLSAPPSTPVQQRREISAFSPYDTPSVVTPFTDRSIVPRSNITPPIEQTPITASKLDLVPQPLTMSRQTSSDSSTSIYSKTGDRLQKLARSLSFSPAVTNSKSGLSRHNTATTWDADEKINTVAEMNVENTSRRDQLQSLLDDVTTAINDFPSRMPDLGSALIDGLRVEPTDSKDEMHIVNLARVFPNTPTQVLSVLAAWIIVDCYISNLFFDHSIPRECYGVRDNKLSVEKPTIPDRSTSLRDQQPGGKLVRELSYSLFPKPPGKLTKNKKSPLKSQNTAAVSPESMQSIPTKARTLLGIEKGHGQVERSDEELLLTRAQALSISVGVIAQRLVEALRGEEGWDPHLWRALGVVVSVVETDSDY